MYRTAHLQLWRTLYDQTYGDRDVNDSESDFVGWQSSYTRLPLPASEMHLWVDETVTRISGLQPRRVVEVGCGTGLLLARLAGSCEEYVAIDFSATVLRQLADRIRGRPDLQHVKLREGAAQDLSFLPDASADLVILNSIVQYFPDFQYLLGAVREAVRITQPGGYVLVGDVRSLPLLEAFHASIQVTRAPEDLSVPEIQAETQNALYYEKELVVDPHFFLDAVTGLAGVSRVELTPKTGAYDNELSRFRYDATVIVGPKTTLTSIRDWVEWDPDGAWREEVQAIRAEIASSGRCSRRSGSSCERHTAHGRRATFDDGAVHRWAPSSRRGCRRTGSRQSRCICARSWRVSRSVWLALGRHL